MRRPELAQRAPRNRPRSGGAPPRPRAPGRARCRARRAASPRSRRSIHASCGPTCTRRSRRSTCAPAKQAASRSASPGGARQEHHRLAPRRGTARARRARPGPARGAPAPAGPRAARPRARAGRARRPGARPQSARRRGAAARPARGGGRARRSPRRRAAPRAGRRRDRRRGRPRDPRAGGARAPRPAAPRAPATPGGAPARAWTASRDRARRGARHPSDGPSRHVERLPLGARDDEQRGPPAAASAISIIPSCGARRARRARPGAAAGQREGVDEHLLDVAARLLRQAPGLDDDARGAPLGQHALEPGAPGERHPAVRDLDPGRAGGQRRPRQRAVERGLDHARAPRGRERERRVERRAGRERGGDTASGSAARASSSAPKRGASRSSAAPGSRATSAAARATVERARRAAQARARPPVPARITGIGGGRRGSATAGVSSGARAPGNRWTGAAPAPYAGIVTRGPPSESPASPS